MLGGTSGEEVQWTVADLDGGGGLMANKNKTGQSTSSKQGGEQRICAGNVGSGHFSVDEWRRHECRMD